MSEHVIRQDKEVKSIYPETSVKNTLLYTVRGREDFVDDDGFFQINFQPVDAAKRNPATISTVKPTNTPFFISYLLVLVDKAYLSFESQLDFFLYLIQEIM